MVPTIDLYNKLKNSFNTLINDFNLISNHMKEISVLFDGTCLDGCCECPDGKGVGRPQGDPREQGAGPYGGTADGQ